MITMSTANNVAAQVALSRFPSPQGLYPPLNDLPQNLVEAVRFVAQDCQVSFGWAMGAVMATIGIALQGTVSVHVAEAFHVPALPAFLLMGERGSGKDRTLRLVLRVIRQWEAQTGISILSARRSYVQQMRQTFEQEGFSAIVDGELDSLTNLLSHPDHRGEILDQLEGNGKGYASQRNAYKMANARLAFLCGAQPTMLQDKIRRYRLEENGFLSRCCMINAAAPAWIDSPVSPEAFSLFENRLLELLTEGQDRAIHHTPKVLALSVDSLPVWNAFVQNIKSYSWQHPRKELLAGWLSRALAHSVKVAAILSIFTDSSALSISLENSYRAIAIGKWLLDETCLAYDYLFPLPGTRAAIIIGRYLQQIQPDFVTDKQLKLALAKDIATPREIKVGISLLISIGAFQPGSSSGGRRGHPESGYFINPNVMMDFLRC